MTTYSVFIGRLQPIHVGHLHVIKEALKQTDEIIICIGSHNEAPSLRNPFNSVEREAMIRLALADEGIDGNRVKTVPVQNYTYNDDRWIADVNDSVRSIIWKKWTPGATPIYFVGPKKESDPDLKRFFPTWGKIDIEEPLQINATEIRDDIFDDADAFYEWYKFQNVTPSVSEYIRKWLKTPVAKVLKDEYRIVKEYKESWLAKAPRTLYDKHGNPVVVKEGPPYPVIFQTVDTVVTCAGHVLMVTRGSAPGKGLLALPGGFVNSNETLVDAAIRELREETKIDVPDKVLYGSIKWNRTFDDPHRSSRGRTITQAYHIALEPTGKLPKVKGSDDAVRAQWIPIDELDGSKIFEDHLQIIRTMTGVK